MGGKTSLIPKPGQFSSENQRPIKYPLQVVYFVPVKTSELSPREVWLHGARAAGCEREMQWNF